VPTTVAVVHDPIPPLPSGDVADTLDQVQIVSAALRELGYDAPAVPFALDAAGLARTLRDLSAACAFNLVESVEGRGDIIFLAPTFFELAGVPFTGCDRHAMYLTTEKVRAKVIMETGGLPTPGWVSVDGARAFRPGRYIVKATSEDASIGLADDPLVDAREVGDLLRAIHARSRAHGFPFFAEQYLDSREFNVSLLGGRSGCEVLPPCEILFEGFRERGLPAIYAYNAKWDPDAARGISRTTRFLGRDRDLIRTLEELARSCWDLFGLSGWARVDFRLDPEGRPMILEVNPNPSLAADASFMEAATARGLSLVDVVRALVEAAGCRLWG
jgi:D-alanine-D-alanine ligase